jgi:hypothetical protein
VVLLPVPLRAIFVMQACLISWRTSIATGNASREFSASTKIETASQSLFGRTRVFSVCLFCSLVAYRIAARSNMHTLLTYAVAVLCRHAGVTARWTVAHTFSDKRARKRDCDELGGRSCQKVKVDAI